MSAIPGCINFFLPKEKWGIGLMGDEKQLQSYVKQYDVDTAYGRWIPSKTMEDYIVALTTMSLVCVASPSI
jgi:hypothetical protein